MEDSQIDGTHVTIESFEALPVEPTDAMMNTTKELSQMRSLNESVLFSDGKVVGDFNLDFVESLVQRLTAAIETQIQKTMRKHHDELLSHVSLLIGRHLQESRGLVVPHMGTGRATIAGGQARNNNDERRASNRESQLMKDTNGTFAAKLKSAASSLGRSSVVLEQMPKRERMLHLALGSDSGQTRLALQRSFSLESVSINEEEDIPDNKMATVLRTPLFELAIGAAVGTNAMVIGWEVDYMTSQPVGSKPPVALMCISYFYSLLFFIELLLRVAGGWHQFICASDGYQLLWNYLDIALVAASFVEIFLDIAFHGFDGSYIDLSSMRIIRMVRLFRLARLIRIVRFIRFVRALRTLVVSILCTLRAVFWSLVLMATIIYVFAVTLTQAATIHEDPSNSAEIDAGESALDEYWGTVTLSMLSLYMSITGGISWTVVLQPLLSVSVGWAFVFLLYISFVYFAVLNVVTGVFCQAAIESQSEDKETMMVTFLRHKQMYTERFEEIFQEIDESGSGRITLPMFLSRMNDEPVKDYFASLELYCADALCLFDIFDDASAEGIRTEEFVLGCLRLKGTARSSDMIRLLNGNQRVLEYLDGILGSMEDLLMVNGKSGQYKTRSTEAAPPRAPTLPFRVFMDKAAEEVKHSMDVHRKSKYSNGNLAFDVVTSTQGRSTTNHTSSTLDTGTKHM